MKKRAVCTLLYKTYKLPFPYQPLWKDTETDFICFTEKTGIFSSTYKICQIDQGTEVEELLIQNPNILCPNYQEIIYLKENQILVKAPWLDNAIVTIDEQKELSYIATADSMGNYIYEKNMIFQGGEYEGRSKLLTIGVPVSNQITVIERCMKGIEPILKKVPSELIVIDTGSKDGTVEITKKYGARVYQHQWCDNMSLVRNIAIHKAEGLWYMSIDDDEWFEDVSEIIDFFLSGKYKEYDTASYIQRNLAEEGKSEYFDHRTLRMAKITPELHFEGRIHDALLVERGEKEYFFEAAAWHTGFAYMNDRVRAMKKSQRNLNILRYDLDEYPMNMRYNYQMANEYAILQLHNVAVSYFFRGISIIRELFEEPETEAMYKIHLLELLLQFNIMESDEFFDYAKNFVEGLHFNVLEAILVYYLYIRMSDRVGKPFKEILDIGKVMEQLIEDYQKNPKLYKQFASTSVNPMESRYQTAEYHRCMLCAWIQGKNMEKATEHLQQLELELCSRKDQIKVWECIMKSGDSQLIDKAILHIIAEKPNRKDEFWNLVHLSVENGWSIRPLLEYLNKQELKEYFVKLHRYCPGMLREQVKYWKSPYTEKEDCLQKLLDKEAYLDKAELELLGEKLKEQIDTFIRSGEKSTAKELLREYEEICPWDKEIEEVKLKLE